MSEMAVDRRGTKMRIGLRVLVAIGLIVVVAANAHLVYVAVTSQPDCVNHLRRDDAGPAAGPFRAAQSSCSPAVTSTSLEGNRQ